MYPYHCMLQLRMRHSILPKRIRLNNAQRLFHEKLLAHFIHEDRKYSPLRLLIKPANRMATIITLGALNTVIACKYSSNLWMYGGK
jgi:hypothetical protein